MNPIAIIFSDLHIDNPSKFNQDGRRTLNYFRVLSIIQKQCIKLKVPALFCGDMFNRPEMISNDLLDIVTSQFKKLDKKQWELYFISGNHDMSKKNTIKHRSPSTPVSLSRCFKFLKPLDFNAISLTDDIQVYGIPYLEHNVGLNELIKTVKTPIVLLHSDYPGAKDTDDREIGSSENLNLNLLNKFRLVLMGHIHKPQRLSKKVVMIGATHQQRRTDRNCKLGYWVLYDNYSLEFKDLSHKFPRFIDVNDEEQIKDDCNYYTVLPKPKVMESQLPMSVPQRDQSKGKIARQYLRNKGIKDKEKKIALTNILEEVDND